MVTALHTVVAGFVRRTWLVVLVAMAVCAVFAARAVDALAAAEPAALPPHGAIPAPKAAAAAPRTPPDGDAFVERNMFCSACAPPKAGPGPSSVYSGHPAVLIATSLGAEPRATVRVVPTEVQGSWGLGEQIPGVGRIEEISGSTVDVVDADGHTKQLALSDGATGAATPVAPPAEAAGPWKDRVTQLDPTTYEVDRSLVRELVSGATKAGAVRLMPVLDAEGGVKGVRVLGARKDTIAAAVGLKTGDVIETVDGAPLRTANQMLDLLSKLDSLPSVSLGGTRGKQPLGLTLKLR